MREVPAVAVGAAIAVQVTRAVALAAADGVLGLGLARIALLALAGLVAQGLLALLLLLGAPRVLAREHVAQLVAKAPFERAAPCLARRPLLAAHHRLLWDNLNAWKRIVPL